jgi:ubiquinone/menaquinone biosynthesis C-methylase UbiE
MRSLRVKVDKFPPYNGLEWDKKISNPDHPNFWKYGVANLIFLDYVKNKEIMLDLGCGTGGTAFFLAERGTAECIIGVDLLKDMIKVAKKNAIKKGLEQKICFLVCDGRHLPFKDSCFEALVSRGDAFCFLVPLKRTVQELKRIMKTKGTLILEMDNRTDWKPGAIISKGFQKTFDGKIAYFVETFTTKRNHRTLSYILDSNGKISKRVLSDSEFLKKGYKACECPIQKIKEETVEIRQGVTTHWPTFRGLYALFKKVGFTEVRAMGDGLLMKLLLDDDQTIIEMMKEDPRLFFEIERRLIQHVNMNKAPTMIVRATVP